MGAQRGSAACSSGLGAPFLVPVAYETTPVFSPDSRSLAFYGADDITAFGSSGQVYIASADGLTKPVAPVERIGNDGAMWLNWSSDSKQIVYYSIETGDYGSIYTVGADGANRKKIAAGSYPVWSPDGTKIAYISGANIDILLINADGSGTPENITDSPGAFDLYPQWSPDGKKLLYITYLGEPDQGDGIVHAITIANPSDVKNISESGDAFKAYWLPRNFRASMSAIRLFRSPGAASGTGGSSHNDGAVRLDGRCVMKGDAMVLNAVPRRSPALSLLLLNRVSESLVLDVCRRERIIGNVRRREYIMPLPIRRGIYEAMNIDDAERTGCK